LIFKAGPKRCLQDGPGGITFKGDADVRGGRVSGEVRIRRAGNEKTATWADETVLFGGVFLLDTPWKINMEPTIYPFRRENDLNQTSMIMFQPLIFRGVWFD